MVKSQSDPITESSNDSKSKLGKIYLPIECMLSLANLYKLQLSGVVYITFGSCNVCFKFMDAYCKDGTNSHACVHSFVSKPAQAAIEWSPVHHFW